MFINECFYVVYCKVSSSQPNASFFVQTVEEFGDDEPRVANVSGYVVHHDEEFHLAFTILEKGSDEVPEPFFDVVQLDGKKCCCFLLGDCRECVEQVESKDFALHQVAANEALPYAKHLDLCLYAIGVLVGGLQSEESVHFDDCWPSQAGASCKAVICRTMLSLQFSFNKENQLRARLSLSDERQIRGRKYVKVEPQSIFPAEQIRAADALKQRQTG